MPIRQQIVAVVIAAFIFIAILELVRKRKLREEYSWLWLLTGTALVILTVWYELLIKITHFIGAVLPTSTLFFFAIIFLMLVCIQFSIKISTLTNQVKDLTQEVAILKAAMPSEEKNSSQDGLH
jgi:hypothetical protein